MTQQTMQANQAATNKAQVEGGSTQRASKRIAKKEKQYTISQYLALEERSMLNHEYDHGKIIPMPGGSPDHSKIKARLVTVLNNTIDGLQQNWDVFNSDIRVFLPELNRIVMPDATIVTGTPEFSTTSPVGLLLNPTLIVEVLSAGTENYDRSEKFKYYRTLPSFEEYVLVSQDQARVETFLKKDGKWFLHEDVVGLEASVILSTLGTSIAMADLYRNVVFGVKSSKRRKA